MSDKFNLDVATPEEVPQILRNVADSYRQSNSDLGAAWQDDSAGVIWSKLATILEQAAKSCDRLLDRQGMTNTLSAQSMLAKEYGKHLDQQIRAERNSPE
jgi:hypothetical protein